MALIKCRDCGSQISSDAPVCPHCGKPKRKTRTPVGCGGCTGAALLFFAVIIVAGIARNPDGSVPASTPIPPAPAVPPPAAQTLDATLTATNHPSETARTTPGSSKAEVTSETDTNQTPQPSKINSFDPALAGEGQALYDKLRKQYPDAKILPDHDLAPHTIFIDTIAYLPAQGRLDLYMPSGIWNKLNDQEKKSLAELLRAKIVEARQSPEKFATLDPRAPAYPNEIGNIRTMPDNSWQIHTGQLDDEGYLNEDDLVAQGSDYSNKITESSVLTYAASDAPVHNSLLNGSVAQVEEYHKKHLNDPDSVEYSNWTKVIETGAGYQVSVTFRSKNEAGGYVIHDQTFSFNKQGEITEVRDNE